MGGPEMAPRVPRRSERPGLAVPRFRALRSERPGEAGAPDLPADVLSSITGSDRAAGGRSLDNVSNRFSGGCFQHQRTSAELP